MRGFSYCFLLILTSVSATMGQAKARFPTRETPAIGSISETEQRLQAIDTELSKLARCTLRSGIGSVGYRSQWHRTGDVTEWVQIDLEREYTIDAIALVPNLFRDPAQGFQSDGFPLEFKIIIGSETHPEPQIVLTRKMSDNDLPRVAPLMLPIPAIDASWVRLEATRLSRRAFDNNYVLQLSEMLIFSKGENVALNQAVTTSEATSPEATGWHKSYLNDGATPYLLDSNRGQPSVAYLSPRYKHLLTGETSPSITIDLGQKYPIDRIHLHAVDQSDTVPQVYIGNHAIPQELDILGANQADFSDAQKLLHYSKEDPSATKPILMLRFPEKQCRYIKLLAKRGVNVSEEEWISRAMGFSEIECFADGVNVALGRPLTNNFHSRKFANNRIISALTDGRNLYGDILPLRQWLEELAYRHELESQRPEVEAALKTAYARQKTRLQWVSWLAAILAVGILIIALIDHIIRLRQIAKIKTRFAADLHDELGANVHTIGLLSDAAQECSSNEADLKMLHSRIRDLSERTGTAIRHCTNMLDAKKLYFGLAEDMRRVAQRNMANYEHTINMVGEAYLSELKPRTRVDIFLFYKECLVNISRHSGATRFATELIADAKGLRLTISDNGKGLTNLPDGKIPKSLKRRARLLKAKLKTETTAAQGTRIILTYKKRRFIWI